MALSIYLSAVNQKLLFTKRLLATELKVSLTGHQDIHQATAIAQSVTLQLERAWYWHLPVSYTHLTLPTIYSV